MGCIRPDPIQRHSRGTGMVVRMTFTSYNDDLCKIEIERSEAVGFWVILDDDFETAQSAKTFSEALGIADDLRCGFIQTEVMT